MKLFIGNLSMQMTAAKLRALVDPFGTVTTSQIAVKHPGGPSKGFGYVTFPDMGEARAAIEALDGHAFEGQSLRVCALPSDGTTLMAQKLRN